MSEFGYITLNFQNIQLFLHTKPPRIREQVIPLRHMAGENIEPEPQEAIQSIYVKSPALILDSPLLLPPRSHIVCSFSVPFPRKTEVCYSPSPDFLAKHEIWAAHSVNKVNRIGIPILLLNPSDKLKTVPRGTLLGQLDTVRAPTVTKTASVNALSFSVKKKGVEDVTIEEKIRELDLS